MKHKIASEIILATSLLFASASALGAENSQNAASDIRKIVLAESVPFDAQKALELAKKSGDTELYGEVAFGIAIEKLFWNEDVSEAKNYMVLASDNGWAQAHFYAYDLTKDSKYAIRAAQTGDVRAYLAAAIATVDEARKKQLPLSAEEYKKAYKWYSDFTQTTYPGALDALCNLAIMHRVGEGIEPDYKMSMMIYQRAADLGSPRGLREIGIEHIVLSRKAALPIEKEKEKFAAYNDFSLAAFLGDANAQQILLQDQALDALMVTQATSPEIKMAKAVQMLLRQTQTDEAITFLLEAAKADNAHANIILSKMSSDDAQNVAVEHLRAAAKRGNLYAKTQLVSDAYQNLVPIEERLQLLQELVDEKIVWAPYNLATLYERKGDMDKAIALYREDAANGNAVSQFRMVNLIFSHKAPGDVVAVKNFLFASALQNWGDAEISLGDNLTSGMYNTGLLPRESAVMTMKGLLDGAKNPQFGFYNLADYYASGFGVQKDVEKAKKICEHGIKQGYISLYFQLGLFYEHGFLGTPDLQKAKELFQKGAELGDPDCINRLKMWGASSENQTAK